MAKNKHLSPLEDPPTDSSLEAESEAVESEEDEEHVEVDEEEEEEEEVESSEEEEQEAQQEQPKKASSTPEVKKNRSKPANTGPAFVAAATPPTKSSQKRPEVEKGGGEGNVSKKAKNENKKKKVLETGGGEEAAAETVEKDAATMTGERPSFFRRFWSEDDEIVILKGIVNFKEKKGPGADINANAEDFHNSIKQSLHVDTTNRKLLDKIRKIKAKYKRNVKKSGEKSEGELFRSPHEIKMFDLSKKIWGGKEANDGGGGAIDQSSTRGGPKKDGEQNAGPSQMLVSDDLLNEKSFMKAGLNLIDIATRSELEQDWKKLKIDEAELYLRRIELAGKQTKLVLDACKKL